MRVPRRLQDLFDGDFQLFLKCVISITPYYSIKYGYDTNQDLWNANPEVDFLNSY